MTRLDYYDMLPAGMDAYLSSYGWHFSKPMCEWAVSMMRDNKNGKKLDSPYTKEKVKELLTRYGITLENDKGYDAVYVANMHLADGYGGSIPDDAHLAMAIKETIDDKDGYEGLPLTRFLADCNGSGTPVIWEDMI